MSVANLSAVFYVFKNCIPGIPHFKEVVIMATVCDYCGHKTNEVKSGGGIEPKGLKINLRVTELADLSRDVLKVISNFRGSKVLLVASC